MHAETSGRTLSALGLPVLLSITNSVASMCAFKSCISLEVGPGNAGSLAVYATLVPTGLTRSVMSR